MKPQRFGHHGFLTLAVIAAILTRAPLAGAATIYWQGGNGASWNLPANWSPAQVPGGGDDVILKRDAGSFAITLGGPQSVNSIEIEDNAIGAYTIDQGTLRLESGGIKVNGSTQTHIFDCDIELTAPGHCLVGLPSTLTINRPIREIGGQFGFTKGFGGTLILNDADELSGEVVVDNGTLVLGHHESFRVNTININTLATLRLAAADAIVGAVEGAGTIDMGNFAHFYVGVNNTDTTFSGSILGTGQFTKQGAGNLHIESDLASFGGLIIVLEGTLTVNGATTKRVHVQPGATLAGNGSVGLLAVNGTVSPGDNGVGTLTSTDLCQISGNTYLEIGGTTPGTQHDQFIVAGRFNADGPLHISYVNGFVASPTDEFILVQAGDLGTSYQWQAPFFPDAQPWLLDYDYAAHTITLRICSVTSGDCNNNGIGDECEPDSDGDGIIDDCDICNSGPNDQDADADGVPDACDLCPGFDDHGPDADGDGLADACDLCYGNQYYGDDDSDGFCNDADQCPGFDDTVDTDGDGVADGCDICPGFDDHGADADGDQIPDACDACKGNDASGDTDGDGVCNDIDRCPGFNDAVDADGDGVPDGCDQCEGNDSTGDTDGDGRCDDRDMCPGYDDFGPDADGDGLADVCDYCMVTSTGDIDGDGDVDEFDLDGFEVCLTGPGYDAGPTCDCYDMEPDNVVNIRDYGIYQRLFTGPGFIDEVPGEINIQNIIHGVSDKGVVLYGGNSNDYLGYSVALIGDMNGDGYGEMLIGAPSYGTGTEEQAGRAYVVYGGPGIINAFIDDIANGIGGFAIDGTGGFAHPYLTREIGESTAFPGTYAPFQEGGPQGEGAGFDVAPAGDVNGDGIPDMIISAPYGVANGEIWGGRTYVVFGSGSIDGSVPLNLNALTLGGGGTGFMIEGERGICPMCPGNFPGIQNGDLSGWAVDGARDVNGDGLADILVSAKNYGDNDEGRAYAVFGKANGASVSLSTIGGSAGPGLLFDMSGYTSNQRMGYRLFGLSDYTGDGLTDFMLTSGDLGNLSYIARSIGASGTIALTDELISENVTVLQGADLSCAFGVDGETGEPLANGCTGRFIPGFPNHGGGDFDGDGRPDLVRMMWNFNAVELEIMVYFNSPGNFVGLASRFGEAASPFVVPNGGVRIYSSNISPANWKNEVTLNSDINGDGYDDVVVGVGAGSKPGVRATYVVFGGPGSRSINLDTLLSDGNGIEITGGVNGTAPGFSVDSSGDVNGDGLNDILIGDPFDDRSGDNAGAFYLIYGADFYGSITQMGDDSNNTLTGTSGDDAMVGGRGDDVMVGNGGFDTMYGGAGDDTMIIGDAGFHRLRGGAGFDTLATSGAVSLDLAALRGRIDEIEQIDLSAAGADVLSLTRIDVLNLSPTSNRLFVRGTDEDEVASSSEAWQNNGAVDVDGTAFTRFVAGRAELYVQVGVPLRFAPVVVTETLNVAENAAIDSSVGFVQAVDPDGGQIVDYAILGGDGQGVFAIDSATGELFVTAAMNFEALSPPSFTLDVQVTDNQGEIGTATIVVNILDLNEMPMWTVQNQIFASVNEHPQSGLLVGNYKAVDPDGGDEVRYIMDLTDSSLSSPATEGAFAFNATTGKLTIANGALLDYETQVSHQMILYAEDLHGLRTEPILVTFSLVDLQTWHQQFDGTFVTSNASMWGTASGVGLSTMGFAKEVDLDNSPSKSVTILGQGLTGQVSGQVRFETTIDTDSGSVNATIPISAEVSFPDEVVPGQSISIGLNLLTPSSNPTMGGMTPATSVDMRLDYTDFTIMTTFRNFGPSTGSSTGDHYLTGSSGRPWSAVVQPDGSLATASTVTTTLMELAQIDWDSYLENLLSGTNLPSNEAENLPYQVGPVNLIVSYVLWGFTMSGEAKVDQDLSLDVNGYAAVIVFENGNTQPMIIDGATDVTLPAGADVNGDGFVDYDIRINIDTTFTNNSDFYGTVYKRLTFGHFDITGFVPNCSSCGTESVEFGPLFDEAIPVNVFQNDALGDYPTPWPENEAGQFPLGGFNQVVFHGAIDLSNE